ncbi:trypsin-like serine protease [Streptomyces caelestis]|uniref:Peptidase S1 domain-containing protein n=1 Tax=Streptomyces caelestis TaxID=36816 RepID=A0A7W9HDF5_9ACTN|nr:trypsin-like serine protease [Streptomyces caelestis]MBB5800190.1 hypothetical protein [Streptomyces caelestis]GGW85801.1 hypothetical protein GCM10010320_79440 [Streptomyces caelestis]
MTNLPNDDTAEPLTLEQLLEMDNDPVSGEMIPAEMRESMSERVVHLSSPDGSERAKLPDLGAELARNGSFQLPEGVFLGRLGGDGRTQEGVGDSWASTTPPHRPDWRPRVYHPKVAPTEPPPWGVKNGKGVRLHKVYGPENRTPFRPEGYPMTCIGRIEVFESGVRRQFGTAALVGPRHIATSAHLMPRDGGAGRWAVRFVPGFFNGVSTVGLESFCEAYRHVVHPNNVSDSTQDRDFAVLKLYNPLGNPLGWFGTKTYDDDWEDEGRWTLVGYPGSITGAERPTFQNGISVIDDDPSGEWSEIEHRGDASDGNSGGPLFGTFPDGLPYIIGVHSGDEVRMAGPIVAEDNNVCAGGVGMPRMVNALRAEWP